MQREPTTHSFENLPESITTRTYVRCLDRLFQSLPPRVQRRLVEPVLSAAVGIGSGIACLHGDPDPPRRFSAAEREASRRQALAWIRLSRERLKRLYMGSNREGGEGKLRYLREHASARACRGAYSPLRPEQSHTECP